jgi:hypothetical protein
LPEPMIATFMVDVSFAMDAGFVHHQPCWLSDIMLVRFAVVNSVGCVQ